MVQDSSTYFRYICVFYLKNGTYIFFDVLDKWVTMVAGRLSFFIPCLRRVLLSLVFPSSFKQLTFCVSHKYDSVLLSLFQALLLQYQRLHLIFLSVVCRCLQWKDESSWILLPLPPIHRLVLGSTLWRLSLLYSPGNFRLHRQLPF